MILDFLVQSLRELAGEHEALLSLVVDEINHQEQVMRDLEHIFSREPEMLPGQESPTWEAFKRGLAQALPRHRMALVAMIINAADSRYAERKYAKALIRAQIAGKDGAH